MADKVYPEGVTAMDHAQHDMKMGRFPNQSSVETFLKERETLAVQEKVGHLPEAKGEASELERLMKPRPLSEWTEEDGDVLWWRFPIEEPPYCGSPNDLGYIIEVHTQDSAKPRIACRGSIGGWPGGYTHWTPIPQVREP